MLTTNTLMNAVEAALKRLYPGEPVYYDELPKDFRRPPFTLQIKEISLLCGEHHSRDSVGLRVDLKCLKLEYFERFSD